MKFALKRVLSSRHVFGAIVAVVIAVPGFAQGPLADPGAARELLEGRAAVVEADPGLNDETRASILELYRQSVEQLDAAQVHVIAATDYQRSFDAAPDEAAAILAAVEERRALDPLLDLDIQPSDALDDLDQRLQAELADLSAAETLLEQMDSSLETEAQRPALARERIDTARTQIDETGTQLDAALAVSENPLVAEARRSWAELRTAALGAEIGMLEQELLSQRVRLDLLNARRAATALSVLHAGLRVDYLTEVVTGRRRTDAEEALDQAVAVLGDPTITHPLIREGAEENIALVEELRLQISELESTVQQERDAEVLSTQISAALRSTVRKLELDRFGAPLGQGIREERQRFPSAASFVAARSDVQEQIATASLRRIENEDDLRLLSDFETIIEREMGLGTYDLGSAEQTQLAPLVDSRRRLLELSVANDAAHLQQLYEHDDLLIELSETLADYDQLLAEQLFRVRTSRAISLADFSALGEELGAQFSPAAWRNAGTLLIAGLFQVSIWSLVLIGAVVLLLQRRRLGQGLNRTSRNVGRVVDDSILETVKALGLTLLRALPLPAVIFSVGHILNAVAATTQFSNSIAASLIDMADLLLLFSLYREVFAPDGPASTHFRWNRDSLIQFHGQMTLFLALFVPVLFLAELWLILTPGTMGGALGFLEISALLLLLSWLFFAVLNPVSGPLRPYFRAHQEAMLRRARFVWIPVVVLLPVVLVFLHASGFRYVALEILRRIADTLWLVLGIVVFAGFAERWLLIARRRLMREAAIRERELKAKAVDDETAIMEEDPDLDEIGAQIDLVALDTGSKKLLVAFITVAAVVGFLVIWNDLLPALAVLDNLSLWTRSVVVDGLAQALPVTLRDGLLAVVIGLLGYIAARDFPALLEIILLRYEVISAGSRYAVTTLSRYAIVSAAVLAVLGMLGASWSQMGWAVAALSVGIGFGLQEIVANFISGLILLFERPIRVGDVITIGDASGTVTRIRIRATTVRDWDRKELVVPNKEFITGRLLNWTLSDPVTRIVVPVGVAYGTDVETAMELMRDAAVQNERVLDEPAPVRDLRAVRGQQSDADITRLGRGIRRSPARNDSAEPGRQRTLQCGRYRHRVPAAGRARLLAPSLRGAVAG